MSGAASPPGAGDGGGQDGIDPLIVGILRMLLEASGAGWVSLPRLGKQLRASGSEVLRVLHVLSDARFGEQRGAGWVQVRNDGLRWQARLTDLGRAYCGHLFASGHAADAPADAAFAEKGRRD